MSGGTVDENGIYTPPLDEMPDVSDVPTAEEIEVVEESQEAAEDAVEELVETPSLDKDYKNPNARIRILERDNRILRERADQILAAIANAPKQQVQEAQVRSEEYEPNPVEDPLGAALYKLNKIEQKLQQNEFKQIHDAQMGSIAQQIQAADSLLRQRAAEDPETFAAAVNHLSLIVRDQTEDEYPDLTEAEQIQIATRAIIEKKLKWMQQGKNPADEYMKMAIRYGFKPPQRQTVQNIRQDAREQIREEKKRDQKSATIAKAKGVSAKPPTTAKELRQMDQASFDRFINEGVKEGKYSAKSGYVGKTPSFSELLPGKGRPTGGR